MTLSQSSSTTNDVGQYITTYSSSRALYIPEQPIGFTVVGIKPNTRISVFFDHVDVTSYCAPASYDSTLTNVTSADYYKRGSIGDALVTDSTGSFIGIFYVPQGVFQVGTKEFHVYNYVLATDTFTSKTSEAYGYFNAFNHSNVDSENNAIISTIPSGSTSSVTLSNRGSGTSTAVDPNNPRFDPMCQTFYVGSDVTQGKDGIYLKAVDLYFVSKSEVQPFTIDIRTVENDMPTTTVLPYSQITLPASSIIADATGQTATRFNFTTPIYLRSGYSYAVSLIPGGQVPEYSVWTGIVGHTDSVNGTVNSNWGQGGLYTSSNGTDWVPVSKQYLKFTLLRSSLSATEGVAKFVNRDYEFLTYSNTSSIPFQVGEYVYQMPSPMAGFVTVNTSSNAISYNASASGILSANLAAEFAVNDHIVVVGSIPPANTTQNILNWGLFSNAFTAKVTSLDPLNNKLTFAFANGATAVAPWANAAAAFFKAAKGTVSVIAGSSTVTGTGTRFDQQYNTNNNDGEVCVPLVAYSSNGSSDNHEILWPSSIANATYMTTRNTPVSTNTIAIPFAAPVARVVAVDKNRNMLILDTSTANGSSSNTAWQNAFSTTSYFAPSRVVVGSTSGATALIKASVDVVMNSVQPVVYDTAVQGTNINYSANVLAKDYSNVPIPNISVSQTNYFTNNEIVVASKTNEINRASSNKSVQFYADLMTTSNLLTPSIDANHISLLSRSNIIGPDSTSEYTNDGSALAKSISKVVTLADGMDAEDLNVYLTAYKPANTQIEVYAKVLNSSDYDIFDNKKWTLLQQVSNTQLYSDTTNQQDYNEYQYTIPTDPTSVTTTDLITTNNSTVIKTTTSTAVWSQVFSNGQQVVLYSDVGNATYEVHTISTVDSNSQITFTSPVSFSNTTSAVIGSLTYPQAAYKNSQNYNIVRYYGSDGVPHDSFKQYAIKIVMLSPNTACVPKISNMRTLALSV